MPGLSTWQAVLAQKHGETKAQRLAEQIRQRYTTLLVESPLPDNPILRRHVAENILPGLSLYQVLLQEDSNDRQAALAEVDVAFGTITIFPPLGKSDTYTEHKCGVANPTYNFMQLKFILF